MKKIDLGQTIGIVANIGVIAGIAFLAVEIRDSNTQARIAATQEVVSQRSDWRELIAGDAVLSDIYSRGIRNFERLDPSERQRFALLMESYLFKLSGNISARNVGLVGVNPIVEARSLEGDVYRMLDQPGLRQWWDQADRRGVPENIVIMVEELGAIRARRASQ